MIGLVVTTAQRAGLELVQKAIGLADKLDVPYTDRNKASLEILSRGWQVNVLVVAAAEIKLVTPAGSFAFHPSMSKPRIRNLSRGEGDVLISALEIGPGCTVLDCTLGLGSDAIVMSYIVGSTGQVVGLECVPVLAEIVRHGLAAYCDEDYCLNEAMRRVQVCCRDHREYLPNLPDNAFDIIYFDPMFRRPIHRSSSMEPLRRLANPGALTLISIKEAVRVAARRVVLKEAANSSEFARLGFQRVIGGRYSPVAYGIIDKGEMEA